VNSFENDDITQFNKLLKSQYNMDPFITKYLGLVQLRLQGKALVNLVSSYDRVKLNWLSRRLGMTLNNVEKLIVKLIIDHELNGRLDQVNMILVLKEKDNKQNIISNALEIWLKTVNTLRGSINGRSAEKTSQSFGGRGSFGGMMGTDYFNDDDDIFAMDSAFLSWN